MDKREYGVTLEGYRRKDYNTYLVELQEMAKKLFGRDIDLTPDNPMGKVLQILAWYGSTADEINEDIFLSQFVIFAEGQALDNAVKLIGLTRKAAQPSSIIEKDQVIIEGTPGKVIRKGYAVGTKEHIIFNSQEAVEIGEDGKATITVVSQQVGKEANVGPGEINVIVNPETGISKVYNLVAAEGGTDTETDLELKERYFRSLAIGGNSTRESIEAALLNLENVIDAQVDENVEMEEINGVPPKAIAPLVYGGTPEVIAETILKAKAAGIRSYGTTEIKVKDKKGMEHTIGYTIPKDLPIYVKAKIEREAGYEGDQEVKTAIIQYIGGINEDQTYYKGLQLGEAVVVNKIIAAIACRNKVKDLEVEVGIKEGEYGQGNILVEKDQIAITDPEKIVIEYA